MMEFAFSGDPKRAHTITLRDTDVIRLDDLTLRQTHNDGTVTLGTDVQFHATGVRTKRLSASLCGQTIARQVSYCPCVNRVKTVDDLGKSIAVVVCRSRRSDAA